MRTKARPNIFFTIGHSTRPLPDFVELVTSVGVDRIVDVRSIPRSRKNPQYNIDVFPDALSRFGVAYEHIAELGGLRSHSASVARDVNAFWKEPGFHNFADYAMSGSFHEGLARLRALGRSERCAIMCAEALWWRCHRRIITDYLIQAGDKVFHILGPGKIQIAHMTPAAKPLDGALIYPAPQERRQGAA